MADSSSKELRMDRLECGIDIETYSATDIASGAYRYSEDPDFQVLLIGYKFSDEKEVTCLD